MTVMLDLIENVFRDPDSKKARKNLADAIVKTDFQDDHQARIALANLLMYLQNEGKL